MSSLSLRAVFFFAIFFLFGVKEVFKVMDLKLQQECAL